MTTAGVKQASLIWMDGEFVPWEAATTHVLTHALHYGTAVFEDVHCNDTPLGPAMFRVDEHLDLLFASAALYRMPVPYSPAELRGAATGLVVRNGLRGCHLRLLVFRGYGEPGIFPFDAPVNVSIAAWDDVGDGAFAGVRAKVSSWRRVSPSALMPQAYAAGHSLNLILARIEALKAGYEEAVLLDDHGNVCASAGGAVFIVRDGRLVTPPVSTPDGVARRSVITIARDIGYAVVEGEITRSELTLADEAFLVETGVALVPITEVDDQPLGGGAPGQIAQILQAALDDVMQGRAERYRSWLHTVRR